MVLVKVVGTATPLHFGPGRLTRVIIWVVFLVIGALAWWIYMQLAPMD